MNVLDEDIVIGQCKLLVSWRIRFRQIGKGLGHKGMADRDVIPLLLTLGRPTFFTTDFDYYRSGLTH